jgi:NhaP-type Na+/H+ or K+/H+ antiporter
MEVLIYLTSIAIVLVIGLLVSILSEKLKISNMLLLVLAGVVAGSLTYNNNDLFKFSPTFIVSIATLALVMIVFDGASRMNLKEMNQMSYKALKLTSIFMLLSVIFVGFVTFLLFFNNGLTTINVVLALIFAFLATGTDPASMFVMFKDKTSRVLEFLKVEAIVNTPIVVLFPFILLGLITPGIQTISVLTQISPFIQQIVTGVGTGIVIGIIIFKVMKRYYSQEYSPIAILTATLITYVIAEQLKGNGVLAVATLGLLFGNTYVKKKFLLREFSSIFSTSLEILVFVLIGTITKLPWTNTLFFIKAFIIYIIMTLCRYLSLYLSIGKEHNRKELIFMSLNMTKGIAVATVILTISFLNIPEMTTLLNLTLVTIIYSLIVSTITTFFAKNFITIEDKKDEETIS